MPRQKMAWMISSSLMSGLCHSLQFALQITCNTRCLEIASAQQVTLLDPVASHLSRNCLPDLQMQIPVSQRLSSCSARGHRDKEPRYRWYLPFAEGRRKTPTEPQEHQVLSLGARQTSGLHLAGRASYTGPVSTSFIN